MRKRLSAGLLLTAVLFLSVITSPAQAATWPIDISDLSNGPIMTGSDGSVTVSRCDQQQSSAPVTKTWNSAGELVNTAFDQSTGCVNGTVGAGHTVYFTSQDGTSLDEHTTAVKSHEPMWRKAWQDSCGRSLNPGWRTAGPDKHLYELLHDGQCGGERKFLHKVNPFTGNELFRKQLDFWPYQTMMTRSGVVFLATDPPALHYYDLNGNKVKTVAINASVNYNTYGFADNGRVYVAHEREANPSTCPNFQPQTQSLAGYDQLGKFFEYKFTPCKRVVSTAPTSTGTVVVSMIDQAGKLSLVSFSADGTKRIVGLPQKRQDGKWFDPWWSQLVADTNGNVVLRRGTYDNEAQPSSSYAETYLLLNGTSLAVLKTAQTDTYSKGVTPAWQLGFAMSQGRLYLALNDPCQAGNSCERKLYSVPFANVGMDYPRGAVLTVGANAPGLRYVALGDSFSSGEGNEPFLDSNGCHRSVGAFPRWLDADTSLPLSLANEDFMACSGATIADVRNGKNGEPSQLNRIPRDARVISISVGGNDAKFGDYVRVCIQSECDINSEQYLIATAVIDGSLRQDLASLYRDILVKTPQAQLYVVGYPYIVPTIGERGTRCPYMSDNELSAARILTAGLNLRAHQATKDIKPLEARQRIHFVDPTLANSPFNGHDICGESSFFHRVNPVYEEYTFHPDANGVKTYKQLVKVALGF